MKSQRRRLLGYLGLILSLVSGYTVLYWWGMRAVEDRPRTLLESLNVVVQTFTTVGYGQDAPWSSPEVGLLVILMQLSGVFVVFLALPLLVVPWLEQQFELRAPTSVDLEDHVVVCGYSSRVELLLDELEAQGVPYVVLVDDRERVLELLDEGRQAIRGDPEVAGALEGASVADASTVVVDHADESNASIVLAIHHLAPSVRIVGFVEDPADARYLEYAGADVVLSPGEIVGEALAAKLTSAVTTQLGDTVEVGEDFEVAELPIQTGSPLDGVPLADSGVREQTGANVIGAWFDGSFQPNPDPDREIDRGTVLLVAGTEAQLESLKQLTRSEARRYRQDRVIVAGHGRVGETVVEAVERRGIRTTVVDLVDGPAIDVVGDATDEAVLREAGIESATAFVVALGDDTSTIYATLVGRECNGELEVVARADEVSSVGKLYRAGADYVVALATVSGRMLASTVLGEEVMSLGTHVELVRTRAPALAGRTLAEADIRNRTGCTVVAVERDGRVLTDLGPDFAVEAGDSLVVAGVDEDMLRFAELAGLDTEPTAEGDASQTPPGVRRAGDDSGAPGGADWSDDASRSDTGTTTGDAGRQSPEDSAGGKGG